MAGKKSVPVNPAGKRRIRSAFLDIAKKHKELDLKIKKLGAHISHQTFGPTA
jgi:hypothetical protein